VFCRQCGSRLPDNATFCPSCGAAVEAPPPAAETRSEAPPSPPTLPAYKAAPPPAAAPPDRPPDAPSYQSAPPPVVAPPPEPSVPLRERVTTWWDDLERRVPLLTLPVAGAAVLAGLGVLLGFVGLLLTITGNSHKVSGATLCGFGVVLAVLAVSLVAFDRGGRPPGIDWQPALYVAAGLAGAAVLFSVIGVVQAHSSGPEQFDGYWAWMPFGTMFAFLCLGWLLLLRPLPASLARMVFGVAAGVAGVLALIGLATGLGDDGTTAAFYSNGLAWLAWALVWAFLAVAGALSVRESPA
jgi:zinc-ribbon domain